VVSQGRSTGISSAAGLFVIVETVAVALGENARIGSPADLAMVAIAVIGAKRANGVTWEKIVWKQAVGRKGGHRQVTVKSRISHAKSR
jgi:ribosomal protein L21